MAYSSLQTSEYKPQFSGHETFPLRYGWLKKAFDAVAETAGRNENKSLFRDDDAIARFGVGRNMVGAIRHWATATGIIEGGGDVALFTTTEIGRKIFAEDGLDPFMEHSSTLWLVHWNLASQAEKTTWFWAFNQFHNSTFDRDQLVQGIGKLAHDRNWRKAATSTIKRDVECFVRTYVARPPSTAGGFEDVLESPLAELGLIKPIGRRDGFRFSRGPKTSLEDGIFLYALTDFWRRFSDNATLSFETLGYEPGSPGRVFLLDETDLSERLLDIEDASNGVYRWSETAGMKQIVRTIDLSKEVAEEFIQLGYSANVEREAA
jgi:hypothetical protein